MQLLQTGQICYILEQLLLLQIEATVVANQGKSYHYKSRESFYKSGQLLQVGTNLLQIGQLLRTEALLQIATQQILRQGSAKMLFILEKKI